VKTGKKYQQTLRRDKPVYNAPLGASCDASGSWKAWVAGAQSNGRWKEIILFLFTRCIHCIAPGDIVLLLAMPLSSRLVDLTMPNLPTHSDVSSSALNLELFRVFFQ
jgi:hypothetical protein